MKKQYRPKRTQLILRAFENLDARALDRLLDDSRTYQDVSKERFVRELKDYFDGALDFDGLTLDFEAHEGVCKGCSRGKKGYAFVNSQGGAMLSMVVEEDASGITDMYSCSHLRVKGVRIENSWTGISFYPDEAVGFVFTPEILEEKGVCDTALQEIHDAFAQQGLLEYRWYSGWHRRYSDFSSVRRVFSGERYTFVARVDRYLWEISMMIDRVEMDKKAQERWREFMEIPVVTEESVTPWLTACGADFEYASYGFGSPVDFLQDRVIERHFHYRFSEVSYYHNVAELMRKYSGWLPEIHADAGDI